MPREWMRQPTWRSAPRSTWWRPLNSRTTPRGRLSLLGRQALQVSNPQLYNTAGYQMISAKTSSISSAFAVAMCLMSPGLRHQVAHRGNCAGFRQVAIVPQISGDGFKQILVLVQDRALPVFD